MKLHFSLLFMLGSLQLTFAQQVTLYGQIIDAATKEPLIGATVVLSDTDLGTVTDIDGQFALAGVTPGSYNLTANYLGYEPLTKSNVIVQSKGNINLLFELRESALALDAVEVVANPFQPSAVSPISLQRLSPEEIKTYPGGNNDIAKVVQTLPGVSGSIGGFRNDVIIRGGAPNENVYYLDGVEIPNINHFSTQGSAGGPVGLLNVNFIREVSLSASAFGAAYDNPLSGVLQFEQRTGNSRNRQTNFRLSASEVALTTEGPLLKGDRAEANTTYLVSVRRSYLQFLFELIQLPIRPDYWDYQYKINHKIDERNTISLLGIGAIDDFSVKAPDDFDVEQQAVLDQVPVIEQRSNTIGLSWNRRLKDSKGLMNTVVSVNTLNNEFTRYTDNEQLTGAYFTNNSRETEQKLRFAYTRFVQDWTITSGFNLTRADYANDTENLVDGFAYQTDLDFLRYGAFVQTYRSFFNNRLDLSFGLRTDANSFSTQNNQLLKTLSPRLSIAYVLDADTRWRVNASIGRYFKIAPYTILGFRDNQGNLRNQDAPYIGSDHLVGGLEYRLGRLSKLSLEAFYKWYFDYPVSLQDGVSLANLGGDFDVLGNEDVVSSGKGRTYGLEFLFQQKLTKNFYGIFAYTFFTSEFSGLDGTFRPSAWDARHLVSLVGGYKFARNWEFSLRYRYVGRSPFAPVDQALTLANYPAVILDYDRLGDTRLSAFNQADIRIDKKWNFSKLSLNLFVEIQNAFAQSNPEPPQFGLARDETGAILEPRSLTEIPPSESAILPIIGLAIDF